MGDLSENLDEWPVNPYALLNVTPQSSTDDVRRAWFRLIRRFKPDKFPAHFQRLHTAYEQLMRYAPDSTVRAEPRDDQSPISESNTDPAISNQNSFASADPIPEHLIWSTETESNTDDRDFVSRSLDEAEDVRYWSPISRRERAQQKNQLLTQVEDMVAAGQLERAAESLLQIDDGAFMPGQRPYWEFLIDSIRAPEKRQSPRQRFENLLRLASFPSGFDYALPWLELELLADPGLAMHPVWGNLSKQGLSTKTVIALFHCRWQFLSWQNHAEVLSDLAQIERLAGLETYIWHTTLIKTLDFVVWHSLAHCRDAIKRVEGDLTSDGATNHAHLYRLDIRVHQGLNWQATYGKIFRSNCHAIPELAPDACTRHPLLFARIAETFFTNALAKYKLFLDRNAPHVVENCSYLYEAVLSRLLSLDFPIPMNHPAHQAHLERIVAAFFKHQQKPAYRKMRLPLLRYCLTYQLSLTEFGQIADRLSATPSNHQGSWSMMIQADLALRAMEVLFHRFSQEMPS